MLIIHGLLLPALLKVTVLTAEANGKGGVVGEDMKGSHK